MVHHQWPWKLQTNGWSKQHNGTSPQAALAMPFSTPHVCCVCCLCNYKWLSGSPLTTSSFVLSAGTAAWSLPSTVWPISQNKDFDKGGKNVVPPPAALNSPASVKCIVSLKWPICSRALDSGIWQCQITSECCDKLGFQHAGVYHWLVSLLISSNHSLVSPGLFWFHYERFA